MKKSDTIPERIFPRDEIGKQAIRYRLKSKTIVFISGVFDILHEGHLGILSYAAAQADKLIVGVYADDSAKKLKGDHRPVKNGQSRALVLASLIMVDAVVIFEGDNLLELIKDIKPDVLVKGDKDTRENIVATKEVEAAGGKVLIFPREEGFSTNDIIQKIKNL